MFGEPANLGPHCTKAKSLKKPGPQTDQNLYSGSPRFCPPGSLWLTGGSPLGSHHIVDISQNKRPPHPPTPGDAGTAGLGTHFEKCLRVTGKVTETAPEWAGKGSRGHQQEGKGCFVVTWTAPGRGTDVSRGTCRGRRHGARYQVDVCEPQLHLLFAPQPWEIIKGPESHFNTGTSRPHRPRKAAGRT